ncbi:MAG: IclR family transcriptional regulator [Chloroflexota bacterium]
MPPHQNRPAFASQKIEKHQPNDVISSVARAFAILELLSEYPNGLLPKEVAYKLKIHISTCYHQLNTMLATGYVKRDDESARFCLTPKIKYQKLDPAAHSPADVVDYLHPHLRTLRELSEESVYLSLWNSHDIYIADIVLHAKNVLVDKLYVGFSGGNHAMALGKVILSHLEQPVQEAYILQNPLVEYTANTITSAVELFEHLDMVSTVGYGTDQEETYSGVFCCSMPIFGANNQIVAAIGMTTTESRFNQQQHLYLEMLAQCSSEASLTLSTINCAAVVA